MCATCSLKEKTFGLLASRWMRGVQFYFVSICTFCTAYTVKMWKSPAKVIQMEGIALSAARMPLSIFEEAEKSYSPLDDLGAS